MKQIQPWTAEDIALFEELRNDEILNNAIQKQIKAFTPVVSKATAPLSAEKAEMIPRKQSLSLS